MIIGLCVAICGGEDFADMETFGREREAWLRKFLGLPNGIPDADTFRRVFERLGPQELGRCLRRWLEVERGARGVVAVDGKAMRGSVGAGHGTYHVVSAFAAESQLVLGETCVEERSNETGAVPELLDLVDVEGAIVTADAMNCQRRTAAKAQLHWCLDVVFREDASCARKDNSPLNMNVLRKTALTCLNEASHGRLSRRKMMFKAALNPEVLLDVLFISKCCCRAFL